MNYGDSVIRHGVRLYLAPRAPSTKTLCGKCEIHLTHEGLCPKVDGTDDLACTKPSKGIDGEFVNENEFLKRRLRGEV